jgi:hypothetical protein
MNNKEKYDYFWEKVAPLLVKRMKTVDLCRSGSILYNIFNVQESNRLMYATPFWDGTDGVNVQWTNDDGVGLGGDTIPWDITGDPELDCLRYYRVVENYLDALRSHTVERYLDKLQAELDSRDDGTD